MSQIVSAALQPIASLQDNVRLVILKNTLLFFFIFFYFFIIIIIFSFCAHSNLQTPITITNDKS